MPAPNGGPLRAAVPGPLACLASGRFADLPAGGHAGVRQHEFPMAPDPAPLQQRANPIT